MTNIEIEKHSKPYFIECKNCGKNIDSHELKTNLLTCPLCGYHFKMDPRMRIDTLLDPDSFIECFKDLTTQNPIEFKGYLDKIQEIQQKTNEQEAIITGYGTIDNIPVMMAIMNPFFMMGSMGCVVGERLTLMIEEATKKRLPIIIFTASGGARMQEGILSLMQMAKTSAALKRFSDEGLLYVTVLTHPTTGGVSASFAMLGDIILGEQGALVGFAGPRVIEQTIRQKLPKDFQTTEFLLETGFVDHVLHRKDLKNTLRNILSIHTKGGI